MPSDNEPQDVTLYTRFAEAYRELTNDIDRREVTNLQQLATGYAWGYQDACGTKDTTAAQDFSYAYGEHAAHYALERTAFRRNVPDCYKLWVEGKPFN